MEAGLLTPAEAAADPREAAMGSLDARQQLLLEESRSLLSGRNGAALGKNYAIRIDRASFHQRGQARIFRELLVYGDGDGGGEEVVNMLPGGGIIGLRTSVGGVFGDVCEKVLMKMLCGDLKAQQGTCAVLEQAQLVTSQPVVLMGTLYENILYGVVPDEAFDAAGRLKAELPERVRLPASERDIWRLCKAAGVSRALIGDTFVAGEWGAQQLAKVVPWLPLADIVQIGLVRALLQEPQVLLLLRVGSDWCLEEQRKLQRIVEAYLSCDGDIHRMVDEIEAGNPSALRVPTSRNAVVVCAADPLLAASLDMQRDLVLCIDSPSRATLKRAADGLDAAKVARVAEIKGSMIFREHNRLHPGLR